MPCTDTWDIARHAKGTSSISLPHVARRKPKELMQSSTLLRRPYVQAMQLTLLKRHVSADHSCGASYRGCASLNHDSMLLMLEDLIFQPQRGRSRINQGEDCLCFFISVFDYCHPVVTLPRTRASHTASSQQYVH